MSRARIDLVAPPFAGHLHPLLGLGRRLARDYEVRVISTEGAQAQIDAAGLSGRAVLPGRDAEIRAIVEPPHAVGSNPLHLNAQLRANLALLLAFRDELLALWTAEPRPDLLIADFTLPVAGAVARDLGIPWWTSHPSPCVIETPDGPPAYLGGLRPGRGSLGRLRDAGGRALIRTFKRGVHRLYREKIRALGFPSLYREDGTEAVYSPERVLAFSIPELEFPRTWPPAVQLIGPVLYTPPTAAPAPPFREGRPAVLITLGTHLPWKKDTMAKAVRAAAQTLPEIDFHFTDGRADSDRRESTDNFHRLGYVSYARDLPRYALVVHHGGAGVQYHTLRAGLPALVLPIDYDQFDHAARLEAAGVARRVHDLRDLAQQVRAALGDAEMGAACRRFAEILRRYRAEDWVAERVAEKLGRLK
ncbi:MAG TPA: nucleotide disphospho-sugar-binding domain-containing protein [Thermoanaerobaculia bacterium]|jgi:UDP:flavonoid glycosyltransferase YjiC (YdhE family)|nr:nucleotide disphospho-sugar-binding domain-containing protein [Thermoanaerobaculia bacterium]